VGQHYRIIDDLSRFQRAIASHARSVTFQDERAEEVAAAEEGDRRFLGRSGSSLVSNGWRRASDNAHSELRSGTSTPKPTHIGLLPEVRN